MKTTITEHVHQHLSTLEKRLAVFCDKPIRRPPGMTDAEVERARAIAKYGYLGRTFAVPQCGVTGKPCEPPCELCGKGEAGQPAGEA